MFPATFDALVLGSLPTHVGLVWTDGSVLTTFEAFDADGLSVGSISASISNGGTNGATDKDRFFGVIDPGGISAIKIGNAFANIEVDRE